jgi:bifunctional DNA-binding transcriptional regulator/antitoxin component of YhaV-PrlF toxin-antitoxin module
VTLPREVREKAHIRPSDVLSIEAVRPGELRVIVLPNLGPRELRERFPIEGPIDLAADRATWQEEAPREVIQDRDG